MRGAGLVVIKVWEQGSRFALVGHEVVCHQHVGLLDHLRVADSLAPEQHVRGNRAVRRDLGDEHRFECMETSELFVDPGARVVTVDESIRELEPMCALVIVDTAVRRARTRPRVEGSSAP